MGFATGAVPEELLLMAFQPETSSQQPNTEASNLIETFRQISLDAEEVALVPDSGQQIDPARLALIDGFQDVNVHQALIQLKGKGKGQGKPNRQHAQLIRFFGNNSSCSICLNRFGRDEHVVRLQCQHLFHEECWENHVRATRIAEGGGFSAL